METTRELTIKVKELTEVVNGLVMEMAKMRHDMSGRKAARELWTIKDVMEYGHCGRTYIQQLLKQQTFTKARKDGGRWLFDPEQVMRYFRG